MEGQKIIHDCNQKNGQSLTIQTMHSRNMQMRLNTFKTSVSTCRLAPWRQQSPEMTRKGSTLKPVSL